MDAKYYSLDAIASSLGLPRPYVRRLAETGQIPALQLGRIWRFDEGQVREALRSLAREAAAARSNGRPAGPGKQAGGDDAVAPEPALVPQSTAPLPEGRE